MTKLNRLSILIIVIMFSIILLVGTVTAEKIEKDFQKNSSTSKYGKVTLKDKDNSNKRVSDIELTFNTDICADNCFAEVKTTLYKKQKLFDKLSFKKINNNLSIDYGLKNYTIKIKTGEHTDSYPIYGNTCNETGCYVVITDYQIITTPIWTTYDNKKLDGDVNGTIYYWRIEGQKNKIETIDWVPTVNNVSITEWALWQSDGIDDSFNEATINTTIWYNYTYTNLAGSSKANGYTQLQNSNSMLIFANQTGDGSSFAGSVAVVRTKKIILDGNLTRRIDFNMNYSFDATSSQELLAIDISNGTNLSSSNQNPWHLVDQNGKTLNVFSTSGSTGSDSAKNYYVLINSLANTAALYYSDTNTLINQISLSGIVGSNLYLQFRAGGSKQVSGTDYGKFLLFSFGSKASATGLDINLYSPANNSIIIPSTQTFNGSFTLVTNNYNFTNSTFYLWNPSGVLIDSTFNIIKGVSNSSSVTYPLTELGTYLWNYNVCFGNSTYSNCSTADSNNTLVSFPFTENSITFNNPTYETSNETFTLNTTLSTSPDTVIFIYNNTVYTTTNTLGNYLITTSTINIPTITSQANNSFFWSFAYSGTYYNSSINTQTINPLLFVPCNVTYSSPLINFTFKDIDTLAVLNGSFNPLTVNYYLGDGSVYKTMSYTNTSGNATSYSFCSNVNKTIYTTMSGFYSASGYPQKSFSGLSYQLNNVSTTNQIFYMISAASGISEFIQVIDTQGNRISGATVTLSRVIAGVNTIVDTQNTDDAGGATFFLSNVQHTVTVTKSGCGSNSVTLNPNPIGQFTVTLGCNSVTQNNTFHAAVQGIIWRRTPQSGFAFSGSQCFSSYNQLFEYSVTSKNNNLVRIRLDLVNQTIDTNGNKVVVNQSIVSCLNPASCYTSVTHQMQQNEILWGKYYIDIGNGLGWILLEGDANWHCILTNVSTTQTVKNVLTDITGIFDTWNENGGVSDSNRAEFSRILFFFLSMSVIMALVGKTIGYDYANPGVFITFLTGLVLVMSAYNFPGNGYFYYQNFIAETYKGYAFLNNYILFLLFLIITGGIWADYFAQRRG